MALRLSFQRVAIAPSVRTAIVVPVDCLGVTIELEDAVNDALVWDAAAGGTSKTLPARAEFTEFQNLPSRFNAGETVCWIEAGAGTGPVLVSYRQ